jgi:NAD(P)-dependent dehydrogenase (short-subunit alcohol dehydrogenase family)
MNAAFALEGRSIAVTGAGRGNGRAIALALAKLGAHVHVLEVDSDSAMQTRWLIESAGGQSEVATLNVTDAAACQEWARTRLREKQPLHGLVNNAGVIIREPLDSSNAQSNFSKVMSVNLGGAFNLTMACLALLKESRGAVVNVASIGSFVGLTGSVGYSASKGGLKSLTQSMACELAPIGVRVNAIAPGVIETDMTTEILQDEVRKQRFLNRIPMGRVGQPEELWGAVAFLLSPLASYVTGVTLPIDGGYLAN